MTRLQLINLIQSCENELLIKGVPRQAIREEREKLDFQKIPLEELEIEAESYRQWVQQRSMFLGEDYQMKESIHNLNIVALYADGGVIRKNPSPIGGTWAWCGVDASGKRIMEESGAVPAPEGRTISNNHTEQIAITKALEAMPEGWSGTVYSDSMVALGRVFKGWKENNLPRNISDRSKDAVRRLGKIEPILLQGHPTKADLESGIGKKRNLPVSEHNVWCDKACGKAADDYLENLEII